MYYEKKTFNAIVVGAILGIFCIIGAYFHSGNTASFGELFSLWYNRIIIGIAIGAPWGKTIKVKALLRGALLGLLVSFAFYSSTGFQDHVSFIAGIVYGLIIEAWLSRTKKNTNWVNISNFKTEALGD